MKKLKIIKIGGGIIDDVPSLHQFLQLFAQIDGPKMLMHGGGKGANEMLKALGIAPQMVNGRRITDGPTLDIVTMFYAGKINKAIVAGLQKNGVNALGMSGADGNVIQAVRRPVRDIDYGFVGDLTPVSVDDKILIGLLNLGLTPVLCPVTHDGHGQLLNTNADTIAAAVAVALSQQFTVELHYCFEKNGVLRDVSDDNSVILKINEAYYAQLKEAGIIADGMIPKLDNSFGALRQGVDKVIIGHALKINDPLKTVLCLS